MTLSYLKLGMYCPSLLVDAIMSLMEFSSRMKDYYDIYYISNKFDIDGCTLTEALKKTFVNRDRHYTLEQLEDVMKFAEDAEMQKKWIAFSKKTIVINEEFATILEKINAFIKEPFETLLTGEKFNKKWSSRNGEWIKFS